MTFLRQSLALALLLGMATGVRAGDDNDAQVWLSLAATKKLSSDFDLVMDMNSRHSDNATHFGHFQVRGLLGWRPPSGGLLGAGYSYVWSKSASGQVEHEHRIYQQANYKLMSIGKAELLGRTRLEERFFSDSDGMAVRVRQQLRLNIPLKGPEGLKAIVHTELLALLSSPEDDGLEGVSQVRTFAGLGIPLTKTVLLEAGYLNQAVVTGDGRVNHALSLGLNTKF